MRIIKRKVIFSVLFIFVFLTSSFSSVASSLTEQVYVTVKINNQCIKMDSKPYIKDGRTYVSIRFVAEALGSKVEWNAKEKIVFIKKENKNPVKTTPKATATQIPTPKATPTQTPTVIVTPTPTSVLENTPSQHADSKEPNSEPSTTDSSISDNLVSNDSSNSSLNVSVTDVSGSDSSTTDGSAPSSSPTNTPAPQNTPKNNSTPQNQVKETDNTFEKESIKLVIGSKDLIVYGQKKRMDAVPEIVNGRTMVPIRFISENLNCGVKWDESTFSVLIDKKDYKVPNACVAKRTYTDEDLLWLARITHVEANGLSINGKVGIANVVLNRVKSPRFPGTVKEVIFAKNQFPPAYKDGFKELVPSKQSIIAAKMALEGINNVENCLFFNNVPFKSKSVTLYKRIDGEYFYY